MVNDKDKINEINILFFVAQEYYNFAIEEKRYLSNELLNLKIGDSKNYLNNDLSEYKHLILFSAHLSSCSVRLYSIEENLQSERFKNYNELFSLRNNIDLLKHKIEINIENFTHIFLRHMTAHAESKRFANIHIKEVLEEMYKIYLTISYKEIFIALTSIMKFIKKDIQYSS